MGRYYFDTSALVKNDHAEAGTADVRRILARRRLGVLRLPPGVGGDALGFRGQGPGPESF